MLIVLDVQTDLLPGSILTPIPVGSTWSYYLPSGDGGLIVGDVSLGANGGLGFTTTGPVFGSVSSLNDVYLSTANALVNALGDSAAQGTTWSATTTITSTVSCLSANPYLDRGIHTITTSIWTSDLRFLLDFTDSTFEVVPSRTPVKRIVRTETWTVSLPPGSYLVVVTLDGQRSMERRTPLLVLPAGA
jgi:hypothetical protein